MSPSTKDAGYETRATAVCTFTDASSAFVALLDDWRWTSGPHTKHALASLARCGHYRGSVVCPVDLRRPIDAVESKIADRIQQELLTPERVDRIVDWVRATVGRRLKASAADVGALEKQIALVRQPQRNLAAAVATAGGDIPELAAELRTRNERLRRLDRTALRAPNDARRAFSAVFPDGLTLSARPERGWKAPGLGGRGDRRPGQIHI